MFERMKMAAERRHLKQIYQTYETLGETVNTCLKELVDAHEAYQLGLQGDMLEEALETYREVYEFKLLNYDGALNELVTQAFTIDTFVEMCMNKYDLTIGQVLGKNYQIPMFSSITKTMLSQTSPLFGKTYSVDLQSDRFVGEVPQQIAEAINFDITRPDHMKHVMGWKKLNLEQFEELEPTCKLATALSMYHQELPGCQEIVQQFRNDVIEMLGYSRPHVQFSEMVQEQLANAPIEAIFTIFGCVNAKTNAYESHATLQSMLRHEREVYTSKREQGIYPTVELYQDTAFECYGIQSDAFGSLLRDYVQWIGLSIIDGMNSSKAL